MKFKISSKFKPTGDQPKAIKELVKGIRSGNKYQTLLGVTGSGKTFTIANVIEKVQKPTLVIAPNKTLAAQLTQEFRAFFPKNAVEYFVSYYDYYQPEAYVSSTDTYIEKEAQINEEIDKLRHSATASLLSRKDVIIVASVSCIYGLGSPDRYEEISFRIKKGQKISREEIIEKLIEMYYVRSEILERGRFRAVGDTIEVVLPGRESIIRIELGDGEVFSISERDLFTQENLSSLDQTMIFPAKHFVMPEENIEDVLDEIMRDMKKRVEYFRRNGKFLEAERIKKRTKYDVEMMREVGYCNGIENYSRYLTRRRPGEAPYTLIDYFDKDFLVVIDESHVAVPQIGGMYAGDKSRKKNLVDNGFRLPSAMDNRPLKFEEFEKKINQMIMVSATPAKFELLKSIECSPFGKGGLKGDLKDNPSITNPSLALPLQKGEKMGIVQQIIRPTGLIDPELLVRSAKTQVRDILEEIKKVSAKGERILITTLTKKQSENLAEFLKENKIKSQYLHSDVETLDRIKILENLRKGKFDVLVGVNLLREGLDLPEVSLVAIFDADKEGFLRNETSLIQTIGRAARNVSGRVILYADRVTGSLKNAIQETERRREIQLAYNKKHKITPKTIKKKIESIVDHEIKPEVSREFVKLETLEDVNGYIKQKEKEMKEAAKNLEFEKASVIRDEIYELRKMQVK
ncbi:MAG: excinuclease ABC subunit UvrB [Candidatus Moranbacteria bacterium]|jgi:excinuclease ABC subunit B|nr:excinuclease ABC subunit UvrB [Candidatus Moranbacteria bacterium]MDD5652193.1 excinuclease ABC subunit UvrB [Candidatus Moranbacteria bacterium]MDX9855531.1 excinuclease ABC subunit UvrB [Candidatus Moranbacteria bacterium]